jgi:uncharacterized SAM-binding protein YcdF (DUF218 family)
MASGGKPRRRRFGSHRVRIIAAAVFVLLVAFVTASALLFVFPTMGAPAQVDAIVVLGGSGDRLGVGLELARDDRAPYLVLSMGLPWLPPGICTQDVGPAKVICFHPDPDTTQGEAAGASRIANARGWTSLIVVTTRSQVWRAHLRFQRCYAGKIFGIAAPVPWSQWPSEIFHQWAGTVEAEVFQRNC